MKGRAIAGSAFISLYRFHTNFVALVTKKIITLLVEPFGEVSLCVKSVATVNRVFILFRRRCTLFVAIWTFQMYYIHFALCHKTSFHFFVGRTVRFLCLLDSLQFGTALITRCAAVEVSHRFGVETVIRFSCQKAGAFLGIRICGKYMRCDLLVCMNSDPIRMAI